MPTIPLNRVNPSRLVTFLCLFVTSVLLAARADGLLSISLWLALVPMFLWDALVLIGAVVGLVLFSRTPLIDVIASDEADVSSMKMTAPLFLLKLAFEVLACVKVDMKVDIHWMVVFLPLYLLSIVSAVVAGIQLRKYGRSIELEVAFAALFLQFLFIPLKLSYLVNWSWATVFVPVWMLLCLGSLVFFYYLSMTVISILHNAHTIDDRFGFAYKTASLTLILVPLLTFMSLLSMRLDGMTQTMYLVINTPLLLTTGFLIWTSCLQRGGNPWWFGMRLFADQLSEYLPYIGNTSYTPARQSVAEPTDSLTANASVHSNDDEVDDDPEAKSWRPPPVYQSILTPD